MKKWRKLNETIEGNDSDENETKNKKQYICEWIGCEKQFTKYCYLKTHRMRHKNSEKYKCEYEGCSKEYKNREDLKRHMNIHTNRYVCDYENCDYRANKQFWFELAHKIKHSNERRFKCSPQWLQ